MLHDGPGAAKDLDPGLPARRGAGSVRLVPSDAPLPLSEDEFADLDDWLGICSPFDVHGLLGLLHAVAVAPGTVTPSVWVPIVLPNGLADLNQDDVPGFMALLLRLQGDVIETVNAEETMTPEPGEHEECRSFAEGYAAGAELDPEWLRNEGHWSYASPLAYLGGRLDLVPHDTVAEIERQFEPDPAKAIREQMASLIHAAHDAFQGLRQSLMHGTPARATRIGRNDPCPCGSGKKYKRCCAGAKPGSPAAN